MLDLSRPIIALLTPFDSRLDIDWRAFESYLQALHAWGVRAVIANGSTGEFPSLTLPERQKVVEFVRENFAGTIINNVSSTCVDDAEALIDGTHGHGDGILVLPPYYYSGARNDGLFGFFEKILSGVGLPVFLYNFPQHTGNTIDNDLVAMLLDHGIGITGIKDSGDVLENARSYKERFPDLKVLFGSDSKSLLALQAGVSGLVSGGANPLPEFSIAIQRDFETSPEKAHKLQAIFDVWNGCRNSIGLPEIPAVKAAMGARLADFPVHVRPPFKPASHREVERIRQTVIECLAAYEAGLELDR